MAHQIPVYISFVATAKFVSPSHHRPLVMGIVNVTPDSFSDGGLFDSFEQALQHATQLIEQGADWLDVGGESTRPGSMPVDVKKNVVLSR